MVDEDWTRSTFGDCASLVRESVDPADMLGVPYIGLEHIGEQSLSLTGHGYSDDVSSTKTLFVEGDILFGKLRPYFRKVIIAPFDGMCSTDIWVVRPKANIDAKYLFYWMASRDFVDASMRGSEGTKMPRAQWEFVSRFERLVPPLETQQAIACILGALDDKIELNRRMNETLEGMAQAIFKSWFVDFDPVRARAAGQQPPGLAPHISDLFPDEFEESESGEIPKGWEVTGLHAVATLKKESVKPMQAPAKLWEHYSIPAFDAGQVPVIEAGEAIKSTKYHVPSSCVLASKLNPRFPRVWLPDVQDETAAICSTEFMPFVPLHDARRPFLYELMKSDVVQRGIQERITGSTGSRQRARPEDVAVMRIVLPRPELIGTFSRTVEPLHEKSLNCIGESCTLAALRDTLLPKLISGEVRVPDAEKLVEAAV